MFQVNKEEIDRYLDLNARNDNINRTDRDETDEKRVKYLEAKYDAYYESLDIIKKLAKQ
jgi:hypothetical protein